METPRNSEIVPREIAPVLLHRLEQFPALALTGPRQTGKSTLLRTILPHFNYMTLDDPFVRGQAESDPELLLNSLTAPAIIDEIQYAPSLLSYIKIQIDQNRSVTGQYVITGSQQFSLIKNLSESLAGRIGLLELLPLATSELAVAGRAGSTTVANFEKACLRGLYPEPALADWESTDAWYSAYIQTYLERDIRSLYDIGSLREFDRLLRLLATRCSQPLNMSSLAGDVGVSLNTVKRWVSILEACRVIYLLPPYYRNLGKRITKAPKVYFTDCGLVCHLTRLRDFGHLLQGPMAGALFENFCIQEALKAAFNQGRTPGFYYLRTQGGPEVDLLVETLDGRLVPFEFKLAQTPHSDMAANLARFADVFTDLGSQPGFVLSLSERRDALSRRVQLLPFAEFTRKVTG